MSLVAPTAAGCKYDRVVNVVRCICGIGNEADILLNRWYPQSRDDARCAKKFAVTEVSRPRGGLADGVQVIQVAVTCDAESTGTSITLAAVLSFTSMLRHELKDAQVDVLLPRLSGVPGCLCIRTVVRHLRADARRVQTASFPESCAAEPEIRVETSAASSATGGLFSRIVRGVKRRVSAVLAARQTAGDGRVMDASAVVPIDASDAEQVQSARRFFDGLNRALGEDVSMNFTVSERHAMLVCLGRLVYFAQSVPHSDAPQIHMQRDKDGLWIEWGSFPPMGVRHLCRTLLAQDPPTSVVFDVSRSSLFIRCVVPEGGM